MMMTDSSPDAATLRAEPAGSPRYSRRLSDKILLAFHQACDQEDYDVATRLLAVLEGMTARHKGAERREREGFVAAHERLWTLRHRHEFE